MKKHLSLSSFSALFLHELAAVRSDPVRAAGGRPPRLSEHDLIAGLVWHVLQPAGYFSHHIAMYTGRQMSDAALSERRQALGTAPWLKALEVFLKPHADPLLHPHAFYQGFRLVGVDGTTLNIANTPALKKTKVKTKTRRGKAAFHRIGCVAAVELGTHNPLALRIGEYGESEGALAVSILSVFGKNDLLIGDRYYGNGKYGGRFLALPEKPKFLVRVQEGFHAIVVQKLKDGSKLIEVKDPSTGEWILLRQIKAKISRPGKRWKNIRLWTNLLDPIRYPAQDLIPLYRLRWEQEIAFYEMKEYLHDRTILLSHTVITAVQEICALFMAQAIVAKARLEVADKQNIPVMQISFAKTLNACRNLCWLSAIAGHILTPGQFRKIAQLAEQQLGRQLSKKRRQRSCPRKVRQPINKWPRLIRNRYTEGTFTCKIRK